LIKAGGETLCSEIFELISSLWTKGDLPLQWVKYIVLPIYKKGDRICCSNCRGMSLLPTTYTILSISGSPYADRIIEGKQCGSTNHWTLFFHLSHDGKKMGALWLFTDVKKAYHSDMREAFATFLLS
jgi:hypothetical protein